MMEVTYLLYQLLTEYIRDRKGYFQILPCHLHLQLQLLLQELYLLQGLCHQHFLRIQQEQVQQPVTAVTAQRNIHIVPEESAQGNVPAAPELCNGLRDIRQIKVFPEPESKNLTQTDGHIRIT